MFTWKDALMVLVILLVVVGITGACTYVVVDNQKRWDNYVTWCQQHGGRAEADDNEWECELPNGNEIGEDGREYEDD